MKVVFYFALEWGNLLLLLDSNWPIFSSTLIHPIFSQICRKPLNFTSVQIDILYCIFYYTILLLSAPTILLLDFIINILFYWYKYSRWVIVTHRQFKWSPVIWSTVFPSTSYSYSFSPSHLREMSDSLKVSPWYRRNCIKVILVYLIPPGVQDWPPSSASRRAGIM